MSSLNWPATVFGVRNTIMLILATVVSLAECYFLKYFFGFDLFSCHVISLHVQKVVFINFKIFIKSCDEKNI